MMQKPIPNSTNYRLDAARVPDRTAYTGARIPAIGLGTFGSDRLQRFQRMMQVKRISGVNAYRTGSGADSGRIVTFPRFGMERSWLLLLFAFMNTRHQCHL